MPWEEGTVMAQRAEFIELARREGANMRALCREFGITPRTGYKWLRRFRDEGEAGLYDRSRRPARSPRRSGAGHPARTKAEASRSRGHGQTHVNPY